jgi:Mg2+ and Co2+ transporter CorA
MGPWPWVGRPNDQTGGEPDAEKWPGYPQSHFPNWTPAQIKSCKIAEAIENHRGSSTIHIVDVMHNGNFKQYDAHVIDAGSEDTLSSAGTNDWQTRTPDVRLRGMFVDNLGGNVLKMLGSTYNIEPFFFSSSLNWIPCRYAEDIKQKKGDHITITLTFLRVENLPSTKIIRFPTETRRGGEAINTQAPLVLYSPDPKDPKATSAKVFLLDLLAIHVVRDINSSTIISYHPDKEANTTSAKELHARVKFAGDSVYWQKIFQNTNDPTFVLLAILWHALYAWDEALEAMYTHFCWLESQVMVTNDMKRTEELHIIRAHLLHYASLLQDFRKSIDFIIKSPNPAMDAHPKNKRNESRDLLKNQCNNLLSEIDRLESWRDMLDKRVKNVMDLAFATVNINDSNAMKQISYLSMIYLPATFVSGLFGMNIYNLNGGKGTIALYAAMTIPLTFITVWVIVAYRTTSEASNWYTRAQERLSWPLTFFARRRKIPAAARGRVYDPEGAYRLDILNGGFGLGRPPPGD